MRNSLFIVAGLTLATSVAKAETPVLTVYTYDSFTAEWGPGPMIETAFEAECACDLQFVSAGDGAALLARILLEGAGTPADVVLGLDTNLTEKARASGLFGLHGITAQFDLPVVWSDDTFLPFDWGWFAFVGNLGGDMPANFQELADSDLKIVIEDPRSSTPGLGLLLWVKSVYGDQATDIWTKLADNIVTVTPGWSEAYGMFLAGEADLVLSYTTSPAYHLIAENDATKVALPFDEGHYLQVEVAAKVAATDVPELADQFMAFILSDSFQNAIPTTNWMYPAVALDSGLPEGFETLIQPEKSLLLSSTEAAFMRDGAIEEWRSALSQ